MSLWDFLRVVVVCFCRLKEVDKCVEKFLEDFNEQVHELSSDEFEKFVSCLSLMKISA